MNNLTISLIESNIYWENKERNILSLDNIINGIYYSNIFVLPEMFNTGCSVNFDKIAETMNGDTVKWMLIKSKEKNALIIGSLCIKESNKIYNRLIIAYPDGNIKYYDKKHLFRLSDEYKYYDKGEQKIIIEYLGWKIMSLICYDLRFPKWSRNKNNYDLLLYVANWPTSRIVQWEKLLMARAIENQCYVAAVNKIGKDNKNQDFCGHSMIIDYKGDIINDVKLNINGDIVTDFRLDTPGIIKSELQLDKLHNYKKEYPFWLDAD
jgi:predicted amidohydrolase